MSKLADIAVEASTCTKCDLASTRTQVVFGHISETSPLMFVGEAPG
jgi:uracil-DNA glycosylase family 4